MASTSTSLVSACDSAPISAQEQVSSGDGQSLNESAGILPQPHDQSAEEVTSGVYITPPTARSLIDSEGCVGNDTTPLELFVPNPISLSEADLPSVWGSGSCTEGSTTPTSSSRPLLRRSEPDEHASFRRPSTRSSLQFLGPYFTDLPQIQSQREAAASEKFECDLPESHQPSACRRGDGDPSVLGNVSSSDKDENTSPEAAKAWSDCARAMMEFDEANVKRWKEEIDTLLVFAGLFSAIVTAFLIESCKSLRPEPDARTVTVLEQIAAQLRNASDEISVAGDEPFVPSRVVVEINSLWFTSLILSLAVAFVGLLVKQWLGEYSSGLMAVSRSRVSKKHAHARQHRYNALRKWRVSGIMTALPALLLVALVLFLVGLSELLITLDRQVGLVALCVVALLFLFSLFTSILPSISEDCSYRSPQAFAIFLVAQGATSVLRVLVRGVYYMLSSRRRDLPDAISEFEALKRVPTGSLRVPALETAPSGQQRFLLWLKRCGQKRAHWSWQEREEAVLMSCTRPYEAVMLDELDSVKMDVIALQDVVRPCLSTLPLEEAFQCVRNILIRRADTVVRDLPSWHDDLDRETLPILFDILLDVLSLEELSFRGPDAKTRYMEHKTKHKQLLEMFKRLAFTGHNYSSLDGKYDRLFGLLLPYIRTPQSFYITEDVQNLVYMLLSGLGDKIPPTALTKEDVTAAVTYASHAQHFFKGVDHAAFSIATLVITMILALNPDSYEPFKKNVCRVMNTVIANLHILAMGREHKDADLEQIFPALHSFLSSLATLLGSEPSLLTAADLNELRKYIPSLITTYRLLHQHPYQDARGQTTMQYLNIIEALCDNEAPGPERRVVPLERLSPLRVPLHELSDSLRSPNPISLHPHVGVFGTFVGNILPRWNAPRPDLPH